MIIDLLKVKNWPNILFWLIDQNYLHMLPRSPPMHNMELVHLLSNMHHSKDRIYPETKFRIFENWDVK